MRIVYCTVPPEKAEEIARAVVKERLAACAGISDGIRSFYWWKGRMENAGESLLIMKTGRNLVRKLMERIRQLHPYEVPEIVSVRVEEVFGPYAEWVRTETDSAVGAGRDVCGKRQGNCSPALPHPSAQRGKGPSAKRRRTPDRTAPR
ncbi:MAG: divalent-cation tolerance protein CutA [Planctomycetota bacterium]|nr:divalent-cation tolerance protein CutA [Planctomycetota bacterium]